MTNAKANVFVRHLETQENFNDILIGQQFGEFAQEDYISNYNHLMRNSQRERSDYENRDNIVDPMYREYFMDENAVELERPPQSKCKQKLKLKGPYSSLSIEPHGLTEATKNGTVTIDRHSVNSVMLENEPQVCKLIRFKST